VTATEFLRKADAALASANRDLDAGDLDGTANRLYYAMFHAARAALVTIGEPAQGRHGTIIAQFGLQFSNDGPLPTELGRAINEAQELEARPKMNSGESVPSPPPKPSPIQGPIQGEGLAARPRPLDVPGLFSPTLLKLSVYGYD
jgi:uncharacterized protein